LSAEEFASLFCVEAWRALARNKLRSTLAALAIMIGIASVVCVVAIGRTGSERAEEQMRNLGENFVWVEAGSRAPSGVRTGTHGTTSLTLDDAEAILREVPLIKTLTPNVDGMVQVVSGDRNWRTRYRGVGPQYLDIRRWPVAFGAAYTEEDVRRAASVCLVGSTTAEKLFGDSNPVGHMIRVDSQLLLVVGVLAPKGQSMGGQDQDDTIILPWTTAQKKIRGRNMTWLDDIIGSAVTPQMVNPAIDEITKLLRQRHHIRPGDEDDFNIRRPDEIINAQIETSHTVSMLLVGIASIALVVGGIGIMNVMLVSVAERTREIGLRVAVGATELAVKLQFIGEAVMLSLFGGALGIVLGVVGCAAIGRFLGWSIGLPISALVLAPGLSAVVGLSFGFYPARAAARLDPIDALRHE
jgi:putative ABC transport system permease protein